MSVATNAPPRFVLLLCEDTYHAPLARLATEVLGVPLSAQVASEHVRRSLLLDARQFRKKVWTSHERCRAQGAELIRVDGFVDSEDSPKMRDRAREVERQVAEGEAGAAKPPCPVRLHVLKPNQEGLLLGAAEPLLQASAEAVRQLGGEAALDGDARAALQEARNHLTLPGKRPTTRAAVLELFDGLFATRRKSFYMPLIGATSALERATFQPEPTCMKSLP